MASCGVKDSFATMDLSGEGMKLLFSATWIHREAEPDRRPDAPAGWVAVTSADELSEWTGQHDTRDVLLPPLLRRAHFRILARYVDDRIVAGAVARLGSGAVDVSNVYAVPGHRVDGVELADVVGAFFPGASLSATSAGTPWRPHWTAVLPLSASCGCGSASGFVRAAPRSPSRGRSSGREAP